MKIKSLLAKPLASIITKKLRKSSLTAVADQDTIFKQLIKAGSHTIFGKEHDFSEINNYDDFVKKVPIRTYEELKQYIDLIKEGRENVLWKGKPLYFAKTSGTTSGVKYIPISNDSIHNHIDTARNALLNYMVESQRTDFADGHMIFLSGSPVLERVGGIPTGRLSGISNHHVPAYLRKNQLPSYTINCIEDWEEKLGKIVEETHDKDMTLISGIPPWIVMYFEWLLKKCNKNSISEIFPNLQIIVHGGVNYAPYRDKINALLGKHVDTIETYPASEGFIAYQDKLDEKSGLILNTNSGIFFEFIPVENYFDENPKRLNLSQVELNKNYAIIINSNAGLWGYSIGDTVKFVSKDPYRIIVTGRIKHFISAFGEHVIAEEVEKAIHNINQKFNLQVSEFTVAPQINPQEGGLPYHEWFIESPERTSEETSMIENEMDQLMQTYNIYYKDLIQGRILRPLVIRWVPEGTFIQYMKSIGKLGGQNKLPRLSNDRQIADALLKFFK